MNNIQIIIEGSKKIIKEFYNSLNENEIFELEQKCSEEAALQYLLNNLYDLIDKNSSIIEEFYEIFTKRQLETLKGIGKISNKNVTFFID